MKYRFLRLKNKSLYGGMEREQFYVFIASCNFSFPLLQNILKAVSCSLYCQYIGTNSWNSFWCLWINSHKEFMDNECGIGYYLIFDSAINSNKKSVCGQSRHSYFWGGTYTIINKLKDRLIQIFFPATRKDKKKKPIVLSF